MQFHHRTFRFLAQQRIGHLCRIPVHDAAGVNAQVPVAFAPAVLYAVMHACPGNFQTHAL